MNHLIRGVKGKLVGKGAIPNVVTPERGGAGGHHTSLEMMATSSQVLVSILNRIKDGAEDDKVKKEAEKSIINSMPNCYLLDILVFCPDFSDSETDIIPRLGVIDIFSVCCGIFWNILEQMAISGVRSVPKNTNSATTLKSSPAQFVHTCAIHSTALYSVRHILKSAPKISERQRVRARFHPKNSATGVDRRALGRIKYIQNKLLKALYGKGSLKNSCTSGHALRQWVQPSGPCSYLSVPAT
jgi:hypothetical protein